MILVAPERAARRADRTPSPGGGRGEGACLDPPAHRMVAQGGRGRTRRGEGHPHSHIAHIRVKGACTTQCDRAVRARDRAARATGSRVTLHQQSPHDSGVRLRALCRLRSAIITELCRLRALTLCITGVLKWKVPSNRDVTLSVPRRPPVSRVPCVTGRRTSVVAAIKFC